MGAFIMIKRDGERGEKMAGIVPKGMIAQSFGRAQDAGPLLYFQEKTLKKIMRWATEHSRFCVILYGAYGRGLPCQKSRKKDGASGVFRQDLETY